MQKQSLGKTQCKGNYASLVIVNMSAYKSKTPPSLSVTQEILNIQNTEV